MSLSKEKCLSGLEDIISTLKFKQKELREDKKFFNKFESKRIIITDSIIQLSSEDQKFVEEGVKKIIEKYRN